MIQQSSSNSYYGTQFSASTFLFVPMGWKPRNRGSWFDSWQVQEISLLFKGSRPALGSTQLYIRWAPEETSSGSGACCVRMNTYVHLAPSIRMSGSISPPLRTPSCLTHGQLHPSPYFLPCAPFSRTVFLATLVLCPTER